MVTIRIIEEVKNEDAFKSGEFQLFRRMDSEEESEGMCREEKEERENLKFTSKLIRENEMFMDVVALRLQPPSQVLLSRLLEGSTNGRRLVELSTVDEHPNRLVYVPKSIH